MKEASKLVAVITQSHSLLSRSQVIDFTHSGTDYYGEVLQIFQQVVDEERGITEEDDYHDPIFIAELAEVEISEGLIPVKIFYYFDASQRKIKRAEGGFPIGVTIEPNELLRYLHYVRVTGNPIPTLRQFDQTDNPYSQWSKRPGSL